MSGPRPSEHELRRRRALVFGDVLPEATRDDQEDDPAAAQTGVESGVESGAGASEDWLRREVPPHHG